MSPFNSRRFTIGMVIAFIGFVVVLSLLPGGKPSPLRAASPAPVSETQKKLTPAQELAKRNAIENVPRYWYLDTHPYTIAGCEVLDSPEQFSQLGEPIQVLLLLDYRNSRGEKLRRLMGFTATADGKNLTCRYSDEEDGLTPSERAKRGALKYLPHGVEILECAVNVADPEWRTPGPPITVTVVYRFNSPLGWTKKIALFAADITGKMVVPQNGL